MNITHAVRMGLRRGMIETRQSLTSGQELFQMLFWPVITLVVLFFLRDSTIRDSPISVATFAMPSVIGMFLTFNALVAMAQSLTVDREDGTLLRAKATPGGMPGYLIGRVVSISLVNIATLLLILVPGVLLFDGMRLNSVSGWLTFLWVVVLGLAATLPIGAVLGALMDSPRSLGLVFLPLMGLVAISGVYFPISSMPVWLQWVGQTFPVYWSGLGVRSALLPDAARVLEIDQSWRTWQTLAVLGAWTVVGLLIAPAVLRRMARRESGSSVAARREKAMQRVG